MYLDNKEDDDQIFQELRADLEKKQQDLDGFNKSVPLRWLRFLEMVSQSKTSKSNLDEVRFFIEEIFLIFLTMYVCTTPYT